jgi:hypothetical protein
MKSILFAATLGLALTSIAVGAQVGQPGALTSQTEKLQSEVIITTLATAELTRQITDAKGTFEHKSEVPRGGPVAAVVRVPGCEHDSAGACKVNADVVVYKPDGSIFHQAKNLDLPAGRAAIPLQVDASAATGVYRVVVTIRDVTARRFATVERQFGVR